MSVQATTGLGEASDSPRRSPYCHKHLLYRNIGFKLWLSNVIPGDRSISHWKTICILTGFEIATLDRKMAVTILPTLHSGTNYAPLSMRKKRWLITDWYIEGTIICHPHQEHGSAKIRQVNVSFLENADRNCHITNFTLVRDFHFRSILLDFHMFFHSMKTTLLDIYTNENGRFAI